MAGSKRTTRTSSGPAQRGSQSTLAFSANRVTKPTTLPGKASKSVDSPKTNASIKADDVPVDLGHIDSAPAIEHQAAVEIKEVKKSEDEERANKVTDAQIKKYWREREVERKAPRVHVEDVSMEEKVLRFFDMSSQYGPSIGTPRIRRWTRAQKLGLNPPIEVLAVLLKEEAKGNGKKIERAYVDELLNGKGTGLDA